MSLPVPPAAGEEGEEATVHPQVRSVILLRNGDKVLALTDNDLGTLEFAGKPNLVSSIPEQQKSLRFRIRNALSKADLTMGYLERGFGWTPSYLIDVKDKHLAEMTMQAVVINDAEDMEHADLFFVVGFPNFKYANVQSPMALQQTLAEMMRDLSSGTGGRRDAGIAAQMVNAMPASQPGAPPVELTPAVAELAGDQEQDLFLYSRPDASLKKGERGLYNVFTANVSYDEIYEWEVSEASRIDPWGNYQTYVRDTGDKIQEAAWHSLRLKNGSKFPWTTAPAMVVHGTKPIAQDMLAYTPKGATGSLKLTVASDIHVEKEEIEVERAKGAVRSGGSTYDAVTVEGTLRVHNYKTTDAPMRVTRHVVGEVLSASNGGKSRKLAQAIQTVNPNSVIEWDFPLKAGEQISIKYRYKVLVRS